MTLAQATADISETLEILAYLTDNERGDYKPSDDADACDMLRSMDLAAYVDALRGGMDR